jgi:hypothetical protein
VRGADPELLLFLALLDPFAVLAGDDERRLPADPELRVDGRDDDVDVRDAAVGREDLLSVEDPAVVNALGLRTKG